MRLLLGLMLLASSVCAGAAEIAGSVSLYADGQALRADQAEDVILYFRPGEAVPAPALSAPAVLSTRRKQFVPRVLAITAGSSVRFPNEDTILHNAFSRSPDNGFDAGLYGTGDGFLQKFDKPGLVKVYCNVHHSMYAYILVLDTPFYTRPDREGRFVLSRLPASQGDLIAYHERGEPRRQRLTPGPDTTNLALRMDLDRRKVPPHTNKFGKPYGRSSNDAGSGY